MQNQCYIFENEDQAFSQLNSDFFLGDRNENNPDTPFRYLERLSARADNGERIMPMTKVQYFTLEIVRLKKRPKAKPEEEKEPEDDDYLY